MQKNFWCHKCRLPICSLHALYRLQVQTAPCRRCQTVKLQTPFFKTKQHPVQQHSYPSKPSKGSECTLSPTPKRIWFYGSMVLEFCGNLSFTTPHPHPWLHKCLRLHKCLTRSILANMPVGDIPPLMHQSTSGSVWSSRYREWLSFLLIIERAWIWLIVVFSSENLTADWHTPRVSELD